MGFKKKKGKIVFECDDTCGIRISAENIENFAYFVFELLLLSSDFGNFLTKNKYVQDL